MVRKTKTDLEAEILELKTKLNDRHIRITDLENRNMDLISELNSNFRSSASVLVGEINDLKNIIYTLITKQLPEIIQKD